MFQDSFVIDACIPFPVFYLQNVSSAEKARAQLTGTDPVNVKTYRGGTEMPALRRVARRTARRTASRQSAAAPPAEAAPEAAREAPAAAAPAAPAAPEKPAYMAELEQLNQLKEQGILSEEEYAAKKQQILGL
jgi:hypothetical protein